MERNEIIRGPGGPGDWIIIKPKEAQHGGIDWGKVIIVLWALYTLAKVAQWLPLIGLD